MNFDFLGTSEPFLPDKACIPQGFCPIPYLFDCNEIKFSHPLDQKYQNVRYFKIALYIWSCLAWQQSFVANWITRKMSKDQPMFFELHPMRMGFVQDPATRSAPWLSSGCNGRLDI